MSAPRTRTIGIIGSGFSGLGLAIQLQKAGIRDFTIYEKSDRLGGTWRDNTYPGAACDVPSMSYCFSFEQKTDWSRKWSGQEEILDYMEHCATKYGLVDRIRFGVEIEHGRWDAERGVWVLRTRSGETLEHDVVVSGVGQLNRPALPDVPGLESFAGPTFHTARWDHAVPLEGRRVAVIGSAATATQCVPEVAKVASRVYLFQRSPNWVLPKGDRAYSEREKRWFTRIPLLARLYRWRIWSQYERLFPVFRQNRLLANRTKRAALQYLEQEIPDPAMRKALTPDYPIGGKRILFVDDFFASLRGDVVELVTEPIECVTPQGVRTADGKQRDADVLILATGFRSTEFLAPMELEGTDGHRLSTDWKDGAEAYLGLSVAHFPNFFMMYGPNTNLGHNSIIFMIECQVGYIVKCVRKLIGEKLRSLDLKPEVMETYNQELHRDLGRMVWSRTGKSWYKREDGKITNNWSSSTIRYWWKTRHPDFDVYRSA